MVVVVVADLVLRELWPEGLAVTLHSERLFSLLTVDPVVMERQAERVEPLPWGRVLLVQIYQVAKEHPAKTPEVSVKLPSVEWEQPLHLQGVAVEVVAVELVMLQFLTRAQEAVAAEHLPPLMIPRAQAVVPVDL